MINRKKILFDEDRQLVRARFFELKKVNKNMLRCLTYAHLKTINLDQTDANVPKKSKQIF